MYNLHYSDLLIIMEITQMCIYDLVSPILVVIS